MKPRGPTVLVWRRVEGTDDQDESAVDVHDLCGQHVISRCEVSERLQR